MCIVFIGSRYVKIQIKDDKLVRVSASGMRTGSWKLDLSNVSKDLDDNEPCFIVFFAPSET